MIALALKDPGAPGAIEAVIALADAALLVLGIVARYGLAIDQAAARELREACRRASHSLIYDGEDAAAIERAVSEVTLATQAFLVKMRTKCGGEAA